MNEEKKESLKPVNINEDVWFYVTPKGFEFVVWSNHDIGRQVTTFRVSKKKLEKYFNQTLT